MGSKDIITAVVERMSVLRTNQSEVAKSCGISQPHLSKVLSGKVKLAKSTTSRLKEWLETHVPDKVAQDHEIIGSIANKLPTLPAQRRMQIMQVLRAVRQLMEQ
jgi:transcriptional regulator with XRE-family HTH domain